MPWVTRPRLTVSTARPTRVAPPAMTVGDVVIDRAQRRVSRNGTPVHLTPTEFDLLLYLAAHRGRVVPCSELVREVRGYMLEEHEAREVIRPHVSNLRRKLSSVAEGAGERHIITVRGRGFECILDSA